MLPGPGSIVDRGAGETGLDRNDLPVENLIVYVNVADDPLRVSRHLAALAAVELAQHGLGRDTSGMNDFLLRLVLMFGEEHRTREEK